VALALTRSADFAIDKPAGLPCPHLAVDYRCAVHQRLRPAGFRGCAAYDCFGAGQHLSQHTFAGQSWRGDPGRAAQMFSLLPVVRALHELLLYLSEALVRCAAAPVATTSQGAESQHAKSSPAMSRRTESYRAESPPPELPSLLSELKRAIADIRELADRPAPVLLAVDVDAVRAGVNPLLTRASELIRRPYAHRAELRGAHLIGAALAGRGLRGASLRGAYLIRADLRRADLRDADLTGADLRDADLCGADLTDALFLTQPQIDAALGDRDTTLPDTVRRPDHWPPARPRP
jgi:hypothetical protein